MQTTVQFLDAIKAARGVSDYALAPLLGVSKAQVSRYRQRHDVMSADVAARVAELLNLDPAYVRACVEIERAERDERPTEKAMWQRIAERFRDAAVVAAFTLGALVFPAPDARAWTTDGIYHNRYLNTHWLRRLLRALALGTRP